MRYVPLGVFFMDYPGTCGHVERRQHRDRTDPSELTWAVREARTRRGLLSGEVALSSGVDKDQVISVLAGSDTPIDLDVADRLLAWARSPD